MPGLFASATHGFVSLGARQTPLVNPYDEEVGESALPIKNRLTRRSFFKLSATALAGWGLYAGEIGRHELSIDEITIHLTRLPDAFRGMRIVQVSDFHYAEFSEAYFLREVVEHVNRLRPDLVVLTGDFVSFGPLPHSYARAHAPECAAIVGGIICPQRYAIMGNHDSVVGARYVIGPLREHGIPTLVNAAVALERDGQRLWLAGLGSACEDESHPEKAIPKSALAAGEAIIVLAHEPDIFPDIAKFNVDLMLSGHTHGGQVRLPFLPPLQLPVLGRNYVEGLFRQGSTQLYVNRGIGAVGVPFRLNCPPQISVLTLG
jgi:uncharacterized protein